MSRHRYCKLGPTAKVSLVTVAVAVLAGSVAHAEPVLASESYLEAVRTFADTVLRCGRDVYGEQHTPLFVDGVDVRTHEPVKWACKGQQWVMSNLANQQNLFRTLDGLTTLTGETGYRKAAEEAIRYAFAHLRSENGLLHWGGHTLYDAASERVVGEGYKHELKCHYPYYRLMWRVDRQATRQFIEAFWNAHVLDWSILDMNRHGDYRKPYGSPWDHPYLGGPVFFEGKGLSFINTGSDLFYAAAMLYALAETEESLIWAKRLAGRYDQTRNAQTGLSGYQYSRIASGDRAQQQFGPEFGDRALEGTILEPRRCILKYAVAGTCQLMLSEMLPGAGREFRNWALADLRAYGRHAYNPEDNTFTPMFSDGTKLSPADVKRDGYYGPAGTDSFLPQPADTQFFRAYALAYRLSGEAFFWNMARSLGRAEGLGDIGTEPGGEPSLNQATDCTDPVILVGLLELYRKTRHAEYLKLAAKVGDNILALRRVGSLFVAGSDRRYTSFGRPEPLALLHLAAAINGRSDAVAAFWPGRHFFHCPYDGLGRTTDDIAIYEQRIYGRNSARKVTIP